MCQRFPCPFIFIGNIFYLFIIYLLLRVKNITIICFTIISEKLVNHHHETRWQQCNLCYAENFWMITKVIIRSTFSESQFSPWSLDCNLFFVVVNSRNKIFLWKGGFLFICLNMASPLVCLQRPCIRKRHGVQINWKSDRLLINYSQDFESSQF